MSAPWDQHRPEPATSPLVALQALLDELARCKVDINYPQYVAECKVLVLTRLLEAHGIVLAEGALSESLIQTQLRGLREMVGKASKPKPPRIFLPRRV